MATSSRTTKSSGSGARPAAATPVAATIADAPAASAVPASKKKRTTSKSSASKSPASKSAPSKAAAPKRENAARTAPAAPDKRRRKLVRDSFTMPREDFDVVLALKERAQQLGRPARKSEVLRAGVRSLATSDDATFRAALDALVVLKKGRPKKGR